VVEIQGQPNDYPPTVERTVEVEAPQTQTVEM